MLMSTLRELEDIRLVCLRSPGLRSIVSLSERPPWPAVLATVIASAIVTAVTPAVIAAVVASAPPVVTSTPAVIAAVSALRTRTALRLDISFRLLLESPEGKSHLAGLLVDLKQLHIDFVAYLEHVLDILCLGPCDF